MDHPALSGIIISASISVDLSDWNNARYTKRVSYRSVEAIVSKQIVRSSPNLTPDELLERIRFVSHLDCRRDEPEWMKAHWPCFNITSAMNILSREEGPGFKAQIGK